MCIDTYSIPKTLQKRQVIYHVFSLIKLVLRYYIHISALHMPLSQVSHPHRTNKTAQVDQHDACLHIPFLTTV